MPQYCSVGGWIVTCIRTEQLECWANWIMYVCGPLQWCSEWPVKVNSADINEMVLVILRVIMLYVLSLFV
jgi:hypothetical protein